MTTAIYYTLLSATVPVFLLAVQRATRKPLVLYVIRGVLWIGYTIVTFGIALDAFVCHWRDSWRAVRFRTMLEVRLENDDHRGV
jgi:hypothetical protein